MPSIIHIDNNVDQVKLCDLKYGSVVSLNGFPDHLYMKVDKRKTGLGVAVEYATGCCVLLNLSNGRLRSVPGGTRVKVYNTEINATRTGEFKDHLKDFVVVMYAPI